MEYFNQPANFGTRVTGGEYFVGWILTLGNPLYDISIHSNLFCNHPEIIKKRSFNVKFHANLCINKSKEGLSPPSLSCSKWNPPSLCHHSFLKNCNRKETNATPFKLIISSIFRQLVVSNFGQKEESGWNTRVAKGSVYFAGSSFSSPKAGATPFSKITPLRMVAWILRHTVVDRVVVRFLSLNTL